MLTDIENQFVNLVITKDLSRLGRDYIQSGYYQEIYFPEKQVRYIAVNDGYDSMQQSAADIAPIKNVINEFYARDTSKKIRSAINTQMREGAFIGNFPPYGYEKDPEDKHRLLVDDNAAHVVQIIFTMAAKGFRPKEIAEQLNLRRIDPPAVYRCKRHPHLNSEHYIKSGKWAGSGITKILNNLVYIGHMAQGKTTKASFKSDVTINKSKEDWVIVKNTHEPIISEEVYERAHRRLKARYNEKYGSFHNCFSGLAFCSDCGKRMSTVGSRKKDATVNLTCGGYKLNGKAACTNHFIDYQALRSITVAVVDDLIKLPESKLHQLIGELAQMHFRQKSDVGEKQKRARLLRRGDELEKILDQLYEDRALGKLDQARYERMEEKYQREQQALRAQLARLEDCQCIDEKDFRTQMETRLAQTTATKLLGSEQLLSLLDRIEVDQGNYENTGQGKRKCQTIHLYFRCAGKDRSMEFNI